MSILCQKCNNVHATVHLTDILNGEKREYHLCSECAEKEGIVAKTPAINQLLQEFVMQKAGLKELAGLTCDHCGMTFVEFRSNGQLGCPNDYDAFKRALEPLIERSHEGSSQHCGKIPRRVAEPVRSKIDLVRMRRELKLAVDAEEYENAAQLRDEIERLEALSLIDDLSRSRSAWLNGDGPMSNIVISSRIRLARNLVGYPFLSKADEGQRRQIYRALYETVSSTDLGDEVVFIDIDEAAELDRQVLVERHLISRQHADAEGSRGVALTRRETVALMINEEDHLRIQVVGSGMQLESLWGIIDAIDDALQDRVDFAFHEQYGFLTACPTNVGTGIRVSVMLHLPALKLAGELDKVSRATQDMRLAVRGLHGEGTEATGDFYQISNQTTLGKSELEILREFGSIVEKIVKYEQLAREALVRDRTLALDDKIYRAYGVLGNSRIISTEEALFLLSHLRMGVNLGRLPGVPLETINSLFFESQPAHLQKLTGRRLSGEARGIARADHIRSRLDANNN